MGWSSGHLIFDPVVKKILGSNLTRSSKCSIIETLINVLEDADWGDFYSSCHCDDPIVLAARKNLHPDEF